MKKIFIIIFIIIIVLVGFLFLRKDASQNNLIDENGNEIAEDYQRNESNYLDMQGYYLYPPANYFCTGGFSDGYRYLDGECTKQGRNDYKINIGAGLASSGINWEEGKLIANQIGVRSFEFTGGQYGVSVCEEYLTENLDLEAEHYLCKHTKDGNQNYTIGVGKSFYHPNGSFGRWFEADLVVVEETNDYDENYYIEELTRFLNQAIEIDWAQYQP